MVRPHILIVSSGNPCRNPRPVKEAAALAAAGYKVTLLTGGDPSLVPTDRATLAGVACDFVFVPDRRSLAARARRWLACRTNRLGFESINSIGDPRPLFHRARTLAADLTIVHNEVPHSVGLRLLEGGRAVAADFEDWHSEDLLPEQRRNRPLRLLRRQEQLLLRRARYCSTTSQALAGALAHERGGNRVPAVITNAFPLQPLPVRQTGDVPSFFWFSQTIGPGRGLEPFLAAWQKCRTPSRVVLLGEVSEGFRQWLVGGLPPEPAARLEFLPLVPPSALPGVIACHDIGLALEDASIRNRDLTITNKILQYLNAGLAVVATATAGQREVLANGPDAGEVIDLAAPACAAASLDQLLADRARLARAGSAARRLAELRYCWEREAPRLVALVEDALRKETE